MRRNEIIQGDALSVLRTLPDASVQCCVTSPPYWGLRDYGTDGQLGAEETPYEYIDKLVTIFAELRRVLRSDGTVFLNLGDTYAANRSYQCASTKGGAKHSPAQGFQGSKMRVPQGLKAKDMVGVPWRAAFALQDDGWWLRSDIVWEKPNQMPSSVKDRVTTAHEYVFMLTKSADYFFDSAAIAEPVTRGYAGSSFTRGKTGALWPNQGEKPRDETKTTRNCRSVWSISTTPYKGAHFAVFPEELPRRCILAGSRAGDMVLDPFSGSGTTCAVAKTLGREFVGIELSGEYIDLARQRLGRTDAAE